MQLRPYQQAAYDACFEKWKEFRKILMVLPTGAGKTIVFSHIAREEAERGRRVLIMAHRDELIRQAADKLVKSTGLGCGIEKAGETGVGSLYMVTVGSVQTLTREKRQQQYNRDHFDTIIVDEAHHVLSDSYLSVLDYFKTAQVLGVTAGPDRGDKKNLGRYFDDLAYEYSLRQAIDDGYLSKITAQTIPLDIDLTNVRTTAGDYNDADLGTALDPYLDQIADHISKTCFHRKTLIFLPLIATSQKMCAFLCARGIRAGHVDGKSPDRSEILQRFHRGDFQVLCNSMLLTEGYDEPSIDAIVCLRPTKVRSLYAQIVGRGTRIHPGKKDLLILDFLWHTAKHDLCHPASLIAETEEIAAKMQSKQDAAAVPMDLEGLEVEAKSEVHRERENALAEQLRANRRKHGKTVDPISFALSLHADDLLEYEPTFKWEQSPASDKQLETIAKFGFDPESIPNKGYASKLLDKIISRSRQNMATPKQMKILEKYGHMDAVDVSFAEAKVLIDRIAANGWRKIA